MPLPIVYIAAAMLVLGAFPLPYGYYTLLRFVGCAVFGIAAYVAFKRKSQYLPWVYALLAIVFNPFIKIHFPKEAWMVIDVAAGLLLLASAKHIKN